MGLRFFKIINLSVKIALIIPNASHIFLDLGQGKKAIYSRDIVNQLPT